MIVTWRFADKRWPIGCPSYAPHFQIKRVREMEDGPPWKVQTAVRRLRRAVSLLTIAFALASCGRVSNDARLISGNERYALQPDRSVVIVGIGQDSAMPPPKNVYANVAGVYSTIDGDQKCWLATNIILSEMQLRYDRGINGIDYYAYDVKPGLYYTSIFVRPPLGEQSLPHHDSTAIVFSVPPQKIVYLGSFVYHGEIDIGVVSAQGRKQSERDIELRRDLTASTAALAQYPGLSGEPILAEARPTRDWARRCGPP